MASGNARPSSSQAPEFSLSSASGFDASNFGLIPIPSTSRTSDQHLVSLLQPPITTPRRVRSYTVAQKLEVVRFANENSISAANRKFNIDRKCIREWRKNEANLLSLQSSSLITPLKKRKPGAGRRVKDQSFDEDLARWLKSELEANRNPSRAHIQWKALEMAQKSGVNITKDFKASTGWLEKFLARHNFRPQSSSADLFREAAGQQANSGKKTTDNPFATFIQEMQQSHGYEQVYIAYKMVVLIDAFGELTFNETPAELGTTTSTESEKLRVTLIITLRSDGQKKLPFVVLPQESSNSSAVFTFAYLLHLIWSENSEIDDELVPLYLRHIFGQDRTCKRLILWNKFGCQLSEGLSQFLERTQLHNMLIPNNFTEFTQALNSEINEKFAEAMFTQHRDWKVHGNTMESASNGNLGPLSMNLFLNWVAHAWQRVDSFAIVKLFSTPDVTNVMNSLGVNDSSYASNLSSEIATVEETCQADYKRFLDKIIENIGLDSVSGDFSGR